MKHLARTCDEVRARLTAGGLSRGVENHLLDCEACAALVVRHLADQEVPPAPEIDALLASVELEIDADRGVLAWLRSLSTDLRWLIVLGVASVILLVTTSLARRPDLADVSCPSTAIIAGYAVLLVVIVGEALRPMHRRALDGLRRRIAWVAVLIPVATSLVGTIIPVPIHAGAQDCLPFGLLVATCLVGVLRVLDRSAHRDDNAALLAVAAGGLGANLALSLHCSDMRMQHLLPAHATVGLVLALVYFGPRRRWSDRSSTPR
jgi:hypothetical protein